MGKIYFILEEYDGKKLKVKKTNDEDGGMATMCNAVDMGRGG